MSHAKTSRARLLDWRARHQQRYEGFTEIVTRFPQVAAQYQGEIDRLKRSIALLDAQLERLDAQPATASGADHG